VKARLAAAAHASPAGFTEIRFEHRRGTTILLRGSEVVFSAAHEHAAGTVRCHTEGYAWGVAGFRTLDELPGALRIAQDGSLAARVPRAPALPPVPARVLDLACASDADPTRTALADKLELIATLARAMRGTDRRVVGTRVQYEDALVDTIVVTSEGLALREERPELTLAALAVAEEAGTVQRATGSHGWAGSWAEVQQWGQSAWEIGERAVLQLHAPPVRPGRYPVVLDPASAGVLAHRAVGHACQADDDALPVGTRLGSGVVTIGDDGTAFGRRGSMAFDHEGTAPLPTILVQHGVVVGHVHSRLTAARDGTGATGHARGAGLEPPRARLGNTYVASGQGELADLLADISLGVYVADPVGVSLDDTRVGLRAGLARMIRRGELAEPVNGVSLGTDPLVLLGLVDRIAADFAWNNAASCCDRAGAGRVPVSTGAPHVRLIEVPVGELA